MNWTYVRDGCHRACRTRHTGAQLLLEVSYERGRSAIWDTCWSVESSVCTQVALEREWIASGWRLEAFDAD